MQPFNLADPTLWNEHCQRIVNQFREELSRWHIVPCESCNRILPFYRKTNRNATKCSHCAHSQAPKYGADNGMDPGPVLISTLSGLSLQIPEQLQGLTPMEEMLIARALPIITVYTVRGGQLRSKGNVINYFQNIERFANELPLQPDEVPLIVRRDGQGGVNHHDFRVRRHKVRAALLWLIVNNKWYQDVHINEARIDALPEDGNLQHLFERALEEIDIPADNLPQQVPMEDDIMGIYT